MRNTSFFLIKIPTLFLASLSCIDAQSRPKEFYDACAKGDLDSVQEYIKNDPSMATQATEDGETCLHLSSISKSLVLAKYLVENGANVNHRVTHDQGLRMTPLSWHTYGGNYEIVELLLENGADVNADFDFQFGSDVKITATDVASNLAAQYGDDSNEPNPFSLTLELLSQQGGKKYEEL